MEIICCIHINLTASNIELALVESVRIGIITRGVLNNDVNFLILKEIADIVIMGNDDPRTTQNSYQTNSVYRKKKKFPTYAAKTKFPESEKIKI